MKNPPAVEPRFPYPFLRRDTAWTTEVIDGEIWEAKGSGRREFSVLNLDDKDLERVVLDEMGAGVDVYYDQRWRCGLGFTRWLLDRGDWVRGKRVLVLGAGLGLEATALVQLGASEVLVNDLSPVAVALNLAQIFSNVPDARAHAAGGRFEELRFGADNLGDGDPAKEKPDCAVASFVVYDPATRAGMAQFLEKNRSLPVYLANEAMPDFRRLLKEVQRPFTLVSRENDAAEDCVFEIVYFDG